MRKETGFDNAIRKAAARSIAACSKSRAGIADEMSAALNIRITEQMLNAYTAHSKPAHRFPAALVPAFCRATGSWELLKALVGEVGDVRLISKSEEIYLQIGKEYFRQREVAQRVEELFASRSRQ